MKSRPIRKEFFKKLSNAAVHSTFSNEAKREREVLVRVIEFIYEIDRRKLYLDYGYPSLFDYLFKEHKYSQGAAQRRIDAARMLSEVPELTEELKSGEVTLNQVTVVAQAIRQKVREERAFSKNCIVNGSVAEALNSKQQPSATAGAEEKSTATAAVKPEKRELLNQVKQVPIYQAQKIVAQALNLEVKAQEKIRLQADESLRLETTLTKEQAALLEEAKNLISHTNPGASVAEVIEVALKALIKAKSPLAKKPKTSSAAEVKTEQAQKLTNNAEMGTAQKAHATATAAVTTRSRSQSIAAAAVNPSTKRQSTATAAVKRTRYIRQDAKRQLLTKQQGCQHKSKYGVNCGSKFQLQIDHIKPIWAGGGNELENLQLLCSIHNKQKYRREVGLR